MEEILKDVVQQPTLTVHIPQTNLCNEKTMLNPSTSTVIASLPIVASTVGRVWPYHRYAEAGSSTKQNKDENSATRLTVMSANIMVHLQKHCEVKEC